MLRPDSPVLQDVLRRAGIDIGTYMVLELAYNEIYIPTWSPPDADDWTFKDDQRNAASRKRAIAKVFRSRSGSIVINEGGLLSHICLYEIAHPYEDVGELVATAANDIARLGHQSEAQSPADIARELHDQLLPGMQDGAEFLIRNQLNPHPATASARATSAAHTP